MGRNRIVSPGTVRLPLSDGDFLTVKKELNAGEYLDLLTTSAAGGFFAKQLAYLVGWTLVGHNDAPIAFHLGLSLDERRDILRSLDTATITEIIAAIKQHEAANDLALEEKKTIPEPALAS
jgi:hypothetical protein